MGSDRMSEPTVGDRQDGVFHRGRALSVCAERKVAVEPAVQVDRRIVCETNDVCSGLDPVRAPQCFLTPCRREPTRGN